MEALSSVYLSTTYADYIKHNLKRGLSTQDMSLIDAWLASHKGVSVQFDRNTTHVQPCAISRQTMYRAQRERDVDREKGEIDCTEHREREI